ncbi:MAG TPA: A24 family peptidase [Anaeromyxobacter sp.]|nr:A24 family peptidase [Anaeromyxobacter sp.]
MTLAAPETGFLPLHLALLLALLLAAGACDTAWRRVPNAIPLAVAALGVIAQVFAAGPLAALVGLSTSAMLLVLLAIPWSLRIIGGGDVKLAAACAAWLGFGRLPAFFLATSLAGGVAALVALMRAFSAVPSTGLPGWREGAIGIRVPYAVAIGAGTIVALYWRLP